jgi:hypothetical protein
LKTNASPVTSSTRGWAPLEPLVPPPLFAINLSENPYAPARPRHAFVSLLAGKIPGKKSAERGVNSAEEAISGAAAAGEGTAGCDTATGTGHESRHHSRAEGTEFFLGKEWRRASSRVISPPYA